MDFKNKKSKRIAIAVVSAIIAIVMLASAFTVFAVVYMVVNESSPIYNAPNELFSIYLIISVIRGVYKDIFPDKEFVYPSSKRIADMAYKFKYRWEC